MNEPGKCVKSSVYWFWRDGSTVKSAYAFLEDQNPHGVAHSHLQLQL